MRIVLYLLPFYTFIVVAQPNCSLYQTQHNEACYEACTIAVEAARYQGARDSQLRLDKAIALCPTLDYAYYQKSIPYLKRGEFITWKKLIDKAVELNPLAHLGYRGWCRYQFLRDYKGAIADFELLSTLTNKNIGYSANGDYHLNIARALCYKALGNTSKALDIFEKQLSEPGNTILIYDYLHLGVLKLEVGDLGGAVESLKKSITNNDYLAENYYYLGLIYKKQNLLAEAKENLEKAKAYYQMGRKMSDSYTHPMDKIFFEDINKAISELY
jgi:tetratricopeptide (TPR) repeat protein